MPVPGGLAGDTPYLHQSTCTREPPWAVPDSFALIAVGATLPPKKGRDFPGRYQAQNIIIPNVLTILPAKCWPLTGSRNDGQEAILIPTFCPGHCAQHELDFVCFSSL